MRVGVADAVMRVCVRVNNVMTLLLLLQFVLVNLLDVSHSFERSFTRACDAAAEKIALVKSRLRFCHLHYASNPNSVMFYSVA